MLRIDAGSLCWLAGLCALALGAASAGDRALPDVSALKPQPEMPDPLTMLDGRKVTTKEQWHRVRRPELKRLFQHFMYGYFPPPTKVRATVEREDRQALGGKATLREVTLSLGQEGPGRGGIRPIHLMLVVPNHRDRPAPIFLGIAFCGNQAVLSDPKIRMAEGWMYDGPGVVDHRATEASRGAAMDVWNVEQSIDRGYAVATFYNGDVEPDVAGNRDGIRTQFAAEDKRDGHYWGTIAAWAWGMQRAVDYLVTCRDLDSKRIAVVGHSRNGKASLLAAAFDERIALAIPLQAGCGGTAPSRGKVGESVKQINTSFPHWFDDTFKQFNDRPELLPFDQNCLVALMAPRPVLFSNATEDQWANPAGQFEALGAADSVYRLLGVEGLAATEMPAPGQLVSSRLGYFIRPGQHSMTRTDWQAFLDYTDRYIRP